MRLVLLTNFIMVRPTDTLDQRKNILVGLANIKLVKETNLILVASGGCNNTTPFTVRGIPLGNWEESLLVSESVHYQELGGIPPSRSEISKASGHLPTPLCWGAQGPKLRLKSRLTCGTWRWETNMFIQWGRKYWEGVRCSVVVDSLI
jgi:hypothetical protein